MYLQWKGVITSVENLHNGSILEALTPKKYFKNFDHIQDKKFDLHTVGTTMCP